MRQRMSPEKFTIPVEELKNGFYTDCYFSRTKDILLQDQYHPRVIMQIFQRQHAVLCGIDEAIAIIKRCSYHSENIVVKALYDGDTIEPWETVMTIEGDLADFVHLETAYLGSLARQTKIATNVQRTVVAANGKPVLFFPSRFDHYSVQAIDGYAAHVGGIHGISTPANGYYWGAEALGTIPHALIATYFGDTVRATNAFDHYIDKSVNRVALIDFNNDCVQTALDVARELGDKLWGVRLDTADTMVDVSVLPYMGTIKPTGVCPRLVTNVRNALNNAGFNHVKIMVSGGFNVKRIAQFEEEKVPVDMYAVGASLFEKNINFTADIVMVDGKSSAKKGREYQPNPRLQTV